jgi:hypothetical protein
MIIPKGWPRYNLGSAIRAARFDITTGLLKKPIGRGNITGVSPGATNRV